MTPERRKEVRLADDASFRARAFHENERLKERIKALESLLAESKFDLIQWIEWAALRHKFSDNASLNIVAKIDAILPKTEEVKDE